MYFLDTDEYIENKTGKLIKDIFADSGEEFFRDLETDTVKEFATNVKDTVISVGGGLPVRQINRELLKELGRVIYLETSEDELVKRLQNDNTRPLLFGEDIRKKVNALMNARQAIYKDAADIVLSTDGKTFEQMMETILDLGGYNNENISN